MRVRAEVLLPAVALFSLATAAAAAGLVDNPIVGDSVRYLNDGWTASAVGGNAGCTFQADTDWKPASGTNSGHEVFAANQDDCCKQVTGAYVAGVFTNQQCWLKTKEDIAGGSYARPGRQSCVSKGPGAPKWTIPAKVPGDLLTDLQAADLIGDPLYSLNFKNDTIWSQNTWTYGTSFTVADPSVQNLLVFDGIKMGANIKVNGKLVQVANDQFLRYTIPLAAGLLHADAGAANALTVEFDHSIDCGGRWMACTGGWDWAPYTRTAQDGIPTFSYGIWKSVYTVQVASAAVTHVVPQISYLGAYPVAPLVDGAHGGFSVDVRVYLWAPEASAGTVSVSSEWGAPVASTPVQLAAGDNNVTVTVKATAQQIKLWWPVGHGAQPLYSVSASFAPSASATASAAASAPAVATAITASRRVGFRMFALVTGNDTSPAYVAANLDTDGTDSMGMFWRINGAVVMSRGANQVIRPFRDECIDVKPKWQFVYTTVLACSLSSRSRWRSWRAVWTPRRTPAWSKTPSTVG
jgi:hypothetical protein